MPKGYSGKIAHIDLTRQTVTIETPAESFYRQYCGGSAMGTYYLLKQMPAGADPLGTDNVLTVFVGPASGAAISGPNRVSINAKSPLTGAVGDSQAGGHWPAHLKAAGFDGLVITGKADSPLYLYLHEGKIEFRSADHLWGKITGDVESLIREELNDEKIHVMQIGPSGEQLSRMACVINMCNRANGRTGMGAVMGSKNLKAIVIPSGKKPEFSDPQAITDLARWGAKNFEDSNVHDLGLHGTAAGVSGLSESGALPTRNWSSGSFEGHEKISGQTMSKTILKSRDSCFGCVIRCKRVVEIIDGEYAVDPLYGGPEYETIGTFGSYCGVDDLAAIAKANELCNRYGLDTISCGATIAWAMDCFEQGIINAETTGGLELKFGNAKAMVSLVELMVKREGFGELLADGSARAAEKLGADAQALLVTAKNQEFPAHTPQVKRSLGLIYAVNAYGADHMSSDHDTGYTPEASFSEHQAALGLNDPQPARDLGAQKVRFALYTHWAHMSMNSLSTCMFVLGPGWQLYSYVQLMDLIRAATGWDYSVFEGMKLGERVVNMQRVFNIREGFTKDDDVLPKKSSIPFKGGASDGDFVPVEQLEAAREMFYALSGWDAEGVPTAVKLEELGIGWTADLLPQGAG